jgi:hypothetical protein
MGGLGVTGSGLTTLQQTAASTSPGGKTSTAWWGYDVLGTTYVSNQAQFNAAVALLRTPDGRSLGGDLTYSAPANWLYPPAWNTIATNLATTDTSVNSAEMTGNPAATVDILANLQIGVLAVEFMPWCACARAGTHSAATRAAQCVVGQQALSAPAPASPSHAAQRQLRVQHDGPQQPHVLGGAVGAVQAHVRGRRMGLEARHHKS